MRLFQPQTYLLCLLSSAIQAVEVEMLGLSLIGQLKEKTNKRDSCPSSP